MKFQKILKFLRQSILINVLLLKLYRNKKKIVFFEEIKIILKNVLLQHSSEWM